MAQSILKFLLKPELLEEVRGDMDEFYENQCNNRSKLKADLNYWYQTINYIRPFAIRTDFFANLVSYFAHDKSSTKMSSTTALRLLSALLIPLVLFAVLVPYSFLIGWNIATLLLFWFIITPAIALHAPSLVLKHRSHTMESVSGLLLFYLFMVFMIYAHYQSDYFKVMMVGVAANLLIVYAIGRLISQEEITTI